MKSQDKILLIGEEKVAASEVALLPKLKKELAALISRRGGRRRKLPLIEINEKGCWNWKNAIAKLGKSPYGRVCVDKNIILAHRYFFERLKEKLRSDLVLDHLCRNTICVNPNHLEQVTIGENVLRGETISSRNKSKTHCPRGHAFEGENLISEKKKIGFMRRCRVCRNESQKWRYRNRVPGVRWRKRVVETEIISE